MTKLPSFFLFLAVVVNHIQPSACLHGISTTTPTKAVSSRSWTTRLHYQDDQHSEQPSTSKKKQTSIPTLPVMGPFLNQPPLMMGAEMILSTPTPLQWQSLEESFYQHQQHVVDDERNTGVSAAPLVAILDSINDMNTPGSQGRYATIAAVVGVSSLSSGSTTDTIHMDDNSAFMESLVGANYHTIEHAKVRLVGVGRALLKEFMYQVPTSIAQKAMDEEGHLLTTEHGERLVGDVTLSEDDDDEDEAPPVNVIMAQFALIHDVLSSRAASPTHAVTKMGRLANQVEWLHQDRRNLVAGIQAAKARLEKAEHNQRSRALQELEDHDGLGLLFGEMSTSNEVGVRTKKPKKKSKKKSFAGKKMDDCGASSSQISMKSANSMPDDKTDNTLLNMVNYGLGSSASSLTGLKDLTQVLSEKLAPYYSPQRCASEEHYYELYSFVAVLAVDSFVRTPDLAWSLRCVHTEQRLQRTYDWMTAHVNELKQEAERMSRALQDCGEECTDLF